MGQIEYSLLKEKDVQRVNDFFNRIHGRNRTIEEFKWEFFSAPAGSAIYILAEDVSASNAPKVIGCQCAIPIYLSNSHGEKILTAKSEDTLVDPEYRGQNIFNKMYEFLLEECERRQVQYIWGFTSALKPFRKIGFETADQYQRGIFIIKPLKTYLVFAKGRSTTDKLKTFAMVVVLSLKRLRSAFGPDNAKKSMTYEIKQDLHFDRTKLFSSLSSENTFLHLDMSESYVKWRIDDNPYPYFYGSMQLQDPNGEIAGDVIYSYNGAEGYIEQFQFRPDVKEEERLYLINAVLNKLHLEKASFVRFMGFNTNSIHLDQKESLERLGFWFMPKEPRINSFIWKSIGESTNPACLNDVLLSKLYTEGN